MRCGRRSQDLLSEVKLLPAGQDPKSYYTNDYLPPAVADACLQVTQDARLRQDEVIARRMRPTDRGFDRAQRTPTRVTRTPTFTSA